MADRLPDLTERLRIRRRNGRTRRWLPVAAALALLLLSLVAAWVVRYSPALRVTDVQVNTTRWVATDAIRSAAAVPDGQPLAAVDLQAVAQRVSLLGPVQRVEVRRQWPHTVVVTVTERTPIYQRRTTKGYQWVDSSGVIFHSVTRATKGLVAVSTTSVDNQLLAGVATVIQSLGTRARARLVSVDATTADHIVLTLKNGRQVVWGSADQSALKSQVTEALLTQSLTTIDVSSPTHPTGR